jgi:carboxyl-terminal processing protease
LGVNGPRYDGPVRAEKVSRGFAAAAAVLVALAIGLYLGGHPTKLPGFMRDVFVEESASLQAEATQTIEDNFIQKVPDEQLRNASVQGMVRSLHSRFSHYFTPAQNKLFEQSTSGEFSGVGMTVVERKKGLEVAGVFKDSPAKRAGIGTGDLIIAVNGRSIAGESSDVSTARIKGKPGTFVRLTIETPGGKQRTIRVQRQTIKVPVVQGKLDNVSGKKLGVVGLSSFTSGAHGELGAELRNLQKRGADGFVLDLRANGGGLLDEAVLVSSLFIPDGVIVTTKGRTRPKRVFDAAGDTVTKKPVVVLVDRGTASASEIVTAALHERLGAPVVGQRTFGKGVFGQVFELSNGGALDLIVGNYYTPKGRNLNGKGIPPNVPAVDKRSTKRDEALDKALATLAKRVPGATNGK